MSGMKRSGFARKEYVPPAPAPLRPLTRQPDYTMQPWSGGGRPKEPRIEIPRLLALARGKSCLLRCSSQCNGGGESTVACHSNLARHGKGMSTKAHDPYSAWGCARCHSELDGSYRATGAEREAWFLAAHDRQIVAWRHMLRDEKTDPLDRAAIEQALVYLKERGYVA